MAAIRKVFALGPGQTCKVGYFRIFGKPQQIATFSLFHSRLDIVLDFDPAKDRLDLQGFGDSVPLKLHGDDGDLVLDFGEGDMLVLKGVGDLLFA